MSRLLLFVSLPLALLAQTPDTATIHGHITDQTHAAVAGVAIKLTNAQTALERTAQTDDAGNFSIAGLPISGAYTVTANKSGFAEARVNDVMLAGGTTADVSLQMNVAGAQAQVTVTGAVGEVHTDSPQIGDCAWTTSRWRTPRCSTGASRICRC